MKGTPGERLVFSRILGHLEIPRSHKWQESSDCWICDKHRYTVIVASKILAEHHFMKPRGKEREHYVEKIKMAKQKQDEEAQNKDDDWGSDGEDLYYDADDERDKRHYFKNNLVSGTFTRWKCRSMLPLGEFLRRLYKN